MLVKLFSEIYGLLKMEVIYMTDDICVAIAYWIIAMHYIHLAIG